LSGDFTQLLFSTPFDAVNALAVDSSGAAFVTGTTPLSGVPPPSPTQGYLAKVIVTTPAIALDNVVSASPFPVNTNAEPISPGKVIRLEGRGFGPATLAGGVVTAGVIANAAAGVQVMFDNIAAPLLYVSSTEIECLVPWEIADRSTTTLQVVYNGFRPMQCLRRSQSSRPRYWASLTPISRRIPYRTRQDGAIR
jgi:hypothetical protein